MTPADIQKNESIRNQQFPVTRKRAFFGHAAVCPLPRRVGHAISEVSIQGTEDDQETGLLPGLIQDCRRLTAELLGAENNEVALIGPTSLGLSFVASGLEWKAGDSVVVYFDDYPSNVYPWTALRERGVEVRYIQVANLGEITPEAVMQQVDKTTRLAAIASCHFISGYRIDINAIGQALHQADVAFCLDAIQTLGAFPTPVTHVDFLAADAHKWMLGPCGAGVFYVSRDWQDRLKPTTFGWNNVRCPDFIATDELNLRSGAHRYEAGSYSLVGLAGLRESLQQIHDVGIANIADDLRTKRSHLIPNLVKQGYTVVNPDASGPASGGITSFHKEGVEMQAVAEFLTQKGFVVSLRTDRQKKNYLRLSPHYYNTDTEIDKLLSLLSQF